MRVISAAPEGGGIGPFVERGTQPMCLSRCLSELLREFDQRVSNPFLAADACGRFAGLRRTHGGCGIGHEFELVEAAARLLNRVEQRVRVTEMQEQRGEIGEGLVERQHFGVGRFREEGANAVDDGMRHLVRDDVVREAGEHALPRQVVALVLFRGLEIAEQDALGLAAVEGVGLHHRMRIELEHPDVVGWVGRLLATDRSIGPAPMDGAPKRRLKLVHRLRGHCIHHLLVKPGIGLGRIQALGRQDERVVQIDGRVVALVCTVIVDHRKAAPHWAGLQVPLPADIHLHHVADEVARARIQSVDAQRASRGLRNLHPGRQRLRGLRPRNLSRDASGIRSIGLRRFFCLSSHCFPFLGHGAVVANKILRCASSSMPRRRIDLRCQRSKSG